MTGKEVLIIGAMQAGKAILELLAMTLNGKAEKMTKEEALQASDVLFSELKTREAIELRMFERIHPEIESPKPDD